MRTEFHQQLAGLEELVQQSGEIVTRSLRRAVDLLDDWDGERAASIDEHEREVESRYWALEREVERVLAQQGPVAGDLRSVLAMLHINAHLQRMIRNCVRIARFSEPASLDELADPALLERFAEMGTRVEQVTRTAFSALEGRDLELAESLRTIDDLVDRDNVWIMDHALALASDPRRREWGLRTLFIARSLERIADHAVAIGEQTSYIITGEFRAFASSSSDPV